LSLPSSPKIDKGIIKRVSRIGSNLVNLVLIFSSKKKNSKRAMMKGKVNAFSLAFMARIADNSEIT
jgi:hypothetical protein